MRGERQSGVDLLVAQSILMSKYNQQYSEIENIPLRTVLFLLHLNAAEGQYNKSEMKKMKSKMNTRGR